MFHFIHCNRRSLQRLRTEMKTVSFRIAPDDLFGCEAQYITTTKDQDIINRNVKDKNSKIIT